MFFPFPASGVVDSGKKDGMEEGYPGHGERVPRAWRKGTQDEQSKTGARCVDRGGARHRQFRLTRDTCG